MPGKYPNGIVFRITNQPVRGWEASFSLSEEEAQKLSRVDQDALKVSSTAKLGGFFSDAQKLPLDEERMQRLFEELVSRGPAVVNVATSRAATPPPKKWSENLNIAYDIILQSEDGLTDEEAGEIFARRKQRTLIGIGNSWRPARRGLVRLGLVRDSGRTRALHSTNNGKVWVVTDSTWTIPEIGSDLKTDEEE